MQLSFIKCLAGHSGKALAILGRRHADMTGEGAAERIGVSEAAAGGDLLGGLVALFEQLSRCADTRLLHPGGRGDADFAAEKPGEVAGAEVHAPGKCGDAVIQRRIGNHPALELLKRGAAGRHRFAFAAELHLSTGAFEEHH